MTPEAKNRWFFGIGTTGRDAVYTLVSLFLTVYLTEALHLSDDALWWVSGLLLLAKLIDCVMDVVMGSIVDNTRSRWGSFKPWILGGVLASSVATVLLFTDLKLSDSGYVVFLALVYLLWGFSWTANDIPYWSLLPALSVDQKERERIGAIAKIFASVGLFGTVLAIVPVTTALTPRFGRTGAWTVLAVALVAIMVAGQLFTLFGVREPGVAKEQRHTSLKEIARVVFGNDQLLAVAVGQILFMLGYLTTTSFGLYYFKYAYRDEAMYTPFAAVLGVAQLVGFALFPAMSRRMSRHRLYTLSVVLVLAGYALFFFAGANIIVIGIAAVAIFFGEAVVVLMILVFISDTVEYGAWKLGRRNQAVTFALQPFINKVSSAVATAFVAVILIWSGISRATTPDDVTPGGLLLLKVAMLAIPAGLIGLGYLVYRRWYTLDEARYAKIVAELRERGELA